MNYDNMTLDELFYSPLIVEDGCIKRPPECSKAIKRKLMEELDNIDCSTLPTMPHQARRKPLGKS